MGGGGGGGGISHWGVHFESKICDCCVGAVYVESHHEAFFIIGVVHRKVNNIL